MDLNLLEETLAARGEPAYRAGQVWQWAARGASGYGAMTNVPAALRQALEEDVPFSTLDVQTEARSRDGTVKTLFSTHDGHPVEAVLMTYRDGRRSLCLSSQSGCPLTCTFCATGQMRFRRNLTASEILDQALHFRRLGTALACRLHGHGRADAQPRPRPRRGVEAARPRRHAPPNDDLDRRLAARASSASWTTSSEPIRLALSLHAPDDALRSQLMPVNDRYPLADVLAECRRYVTLRRRKVFVEYVMLAGVNDRVEQARQLASLLDPRSFKVNLIPYNPTGAFDGSSRKAIDAFKDVLDRAGLPATVRLTRGRDIDAACGQLAAKNAA